jgi:hypothetical protein
MIQVKSTCPNLLKSIERYKRFTCVVRCSKINITEEKKWTRMTIMLQIQIPPRAPKKKTKPVRSKRPTMQVKTEPMDSFNDVPESVNMITIQDKSLLSDLKFEDVDELNPTPNAPNHPKSSN